MFNYQVQPAFSTPIVCANIGPLDPIALAWVKNLRYEPNAVGQTDNESALPFKERGFNIINEPPLRQLRNNISEMVNYYAYELLDVTRDVTFYFTTSWINRLQPEEKIEIHPHTNSVISGVYYIDVTENSSPIHFQKNNMHLNTWPLSIKPKQAGKNWNQFNSDSYTFYPQNGLCILFPSHLEHWVEKSNDNKYRYGLAFNLFPWGELGENSGRLEI